MAKMTLDKLSDKARQPTTQDFWTNPFFNQHARKAFRAYASMQMRQMQAFVTGRVSQCESPLEAAFMAWWLVVNSVGASSLEILPQHEAIARGKRYRIDFVVKAVRGGTYGLFAGVEDAPKVAIELDGHHYHEVTPAQATKRNKRDRDLIAEGWTVLHVSFSEFHDDAIGVVAAIVDDAEHVFEAALTGRLLAE